MPDLRRHRGPHPEDARLFAPPWHPRLRAATADLSWLLARAYAEVAALKLVGDHHQLDARQRRAVMRCAAPPALAAARRASRVPIGGARVAVDGFNALVTVEAALSGGVLLRGADGLLRDLASVHGTWRTVEETNRALDLLFAALQPAAAVTWRLDRPVSNSGRLAELIRQRGGEASLTDHADGALAGLAAAGWALASADGPLLDRAAVAVDLTGAALADVPGLWIVELG